MEKLTDLLAQAAFLDNAIFVVATLVFGLGMLLLLKRKKR